MKHTRNLSELLKSKFQFEDNSSQRESKINFLSQTEYLNPKEEYFQNQQSKAEENFTDCYILGHTIGQGAHGVVKKCWKKKNYDNKTYAVKIIRSNDEEIIRTTKNTYLIGRMLRHQSLLLPLQLFVEEDVSYLVMEYSPFPTLEHLLKKKKYLDEKVTKIIVKNLLLVLQYIHSKGVCHRDIKPDNILVNPRNYSIQLTDFGVSSKFRLQEPGQIQTSDILLWTATGNILYRAPEIHEMIGYNQKVDLWAVGIVTIQCLTNRLPFTQEEIISGGIVKDQIKNILCICDLPKLCSDFIARILEINPSIRLDAKDGLLHPWLYIQNCKSDQMQGEVHNSQDDIFMSRVSIQFLYSPEMSPTQSKIEIGEIKIKKKELSSNVQIQFLGQINSEETGQKYSNRILSDLDLDEVVSTSDRDQSQDEFDFNEEIQVQELQQFEKIKDLVRRDMNLNQSF